MNTFATLVTSNDVLLDIDAPNTKSLFRALAAVWQRFYGVDASEVADSLLARENLGSTGLGEGVAIPHARIAGLHQAIGAVVCPKTPIPFNSPDGKPVRQCFVLLVPEEATEQHLQILADAVQLLAESRFRDSLDLCKSQEDVCELLTSWQKAASGAGT